jgi:precorrin-2 methylase
MVLYIIGLGLGDEKDVTVKGLEYIRSSAAIYLEVASIHSLPLSLSFLLIQLIALYLDSMRRCIQAGRVLRTIHYYL